MGDSSETKNIESGAPPPMGRYTLLARLGDGGMADVFLAVARGPAGFNKLAVVKRLRRQGDEEHVQMFLDEARLSARLSHPNIVQTHEVGDVDRNLYIAMEYLEGQSLEAITTTLAKGSRKGLSEAEAAFITAQVAKGLHYAHELADYDGKPLHIVHRDVSPHNVFVTYRGEVKLLDFGIAKATVNATHTETGVLKGKLRYMAPEQVGDRDIDRRVNVFTLGIILWEILARRRLFEGDAMKVMAKLGREEDPPLRSIRSDISPELETIVQKALRRDRDERYASAEEMRVDLERFLRKQDAAIDAQLGRRVSELFAPTREAVRGRINAFLAALPASEKDVPSTPGLASAPETLPELLASGSGPKNAPVSSLETSHGASAQVLSTVAAAPRRQPRWVFPVVGAMLAVGATVYVATQSHHPSPATAQSDAVSPAPAKIHLETVPSGATVAMDGKPVGTTPLDLSHAPGPASLVLSHDGYEPETVSLQVTANAVIDRALSLRASAPTAPPTLTPPPAVSSVAPAPAPHTQPPRASKQGGHPSAPAPQPSASAEPRKILVIDNP